MHSVGQRFGLVSNSRILMEKESDAALIGLAREKSWFGLVWFGYVLTLHFRAYDTMSLHVYMHYGWMVGWMDWLVLCLQIFDVQQYTHFAAPQYR